MPRTDGAVTLYRREALWCHGGVTPGLRFSGAFQQTVETQTGLLFPSIAASGLLVLVGGQGHSDGQLHLELVNPTEIHRHLGTFGPAFGANPVLIRGVADGWDVACVRSPTTVELLKVTFAGDVTSLGIQQIPHSSQGIVGWLGDGFAFGDPTTRVIAGRKVSEPSPVEHASGWHICQDNYGNRIVFVHDVPIGSDRLGMAFEAYPSTIAQRPKAVKLPDGTFALTASEDGPRIAAMRPPELSDESIGRPLATPDPQPVPPVPVPEPEPMPDLNALTDMVRLTVNAVHATHPHLLQANTTAACGEFTERVVNILSLKDAQFGHVGKSPGQTNYRLHAVDAVMYREPKQVWDIIGGAENHPHPGSPQANPAEHGGQPWMKAIPVAGGGSAPVPVPPAPAPIQPPVDLHTFLMVEYPKLVAEFMRKRPELGEPGHQWAAFTTWRRAVEGWSYERVFAEV